MVLAVNLNPAFYLVLAGFLSVAAHQIAVRGHGVFQHLAVFVHIVGLVDPAVFRHGAVRFEIIFHALNGLPSVFQGTSP